VHLYALITGIGCERTIPMLVGCCSEPAGVQVTPALTSEEHVLSVLTRHKLGDPFANFKQSRMTHVDHSQISQAQLGLIGLKRSSPECQERALASPEFAGRARHEAICHGGKGTTCDNERLWYLITKVSSTLSQFGQSAHLRDLTDSSHLHQPRRGGRICRGVETAHMQEELKD
jgi:hypothetical protein